MVRSVAGQNTNCQVRNLKKKLGMSLYRVCLFRLKSMYELVRRVLLYILT